MRKLFVRVLLYLMDNHREIARLIFNSAAFAIKNIRNYKIVNVVWLDECYVNMGKTLRVATEGVAYGPLRMRDTYTRKQIVQLPEIKCYVFQNGVVSASSSSVLKNDGILAIERVGRYESHDFDYSAGHIHRDRGKSALIKVTDRIRHDRGIFLGGNGAFNYYHWLIEIAPKLEFVDKLPDSYGDFPLLVSHAVLDIPSFSSILSKFCSNRRVIGLDENLSYEVEQLVYIGTPNNLPFNLRAGRTSEIGHTLIHPESINFIRDKCLTSDVLGVDNTHYPKKVFLKRNQERRRYNQEEVERYLNERGFESVFMEDLTFDQQVRVMQNAEWIVGPTGAAWANLVFCKPHTNALCWMADELADFSAFSTIAGHVNVSLRYITYTTGLHSTADLYYADYKIDLMAIDNYISKNTYGSTCA